MIERRDGGEAPRDEPLGRRGEERRHLVAVAREELTDVREALEAGGYRLESAGLSMVPKTTVAIADESTAKQVVRLVEGLEENDDVQDVYANFDIPEAVLEAVAG